MSQRARTMRDWLVSREVEARRIVAKGYGETRPIASNGTKEGRAANTRVEVWILEPPTPAPVAAPRPWG